MKKGIMVVLLVMFLAPICSASIDGEQANESLFKLIVKIHDNAAATAIVQNGLKVKGNGIVTDHSASIDETDRSNISTLAGKLNTLIAAAEDVRDYAEGTWDLDL